MSYVKEHASIDLYLYPYHHIYTPNLVMEIYKNKRKRPFMLKKNNLKFLADENIVPLPV
jgi:hypothetical protein